MKIIFAVIEILLLGCNARQREDRIHIGGIWIPQVVNWHDGDFETYYFLDDSTAVIIASTQKKIKDSIFFATEPGFNIKKGIIRRISDTQFAITGKVIYRFIKIVGDEKVFADTVAIGHGNEKESVMINGKRYEQGTLYTDESKKRIITIATKMVPDIEKYPKRFN